MTIFTAKNAAGPVAAKLGLPISRVYAAFLHVAGEGGHPRLGQVRYRLSPQEIAEGVLCACAWGAHLTDDLPGFHAAVRRSGIADRLAEMVGLVWEHGGGVVLGDSITLDGEGRAAWERVTAEEPDCYHFGGSPRGRAFVLTGDAIALAAQAARVAATVNRACDRLVQREVSPAP